MICTHFSFEPVRFAVFLARFHMFEVVKRYKKRKIENNKLWAVIQEDLSWDAVP